jgi:hypothetical protein
MRPLIYWGWHDIPGNNTIEQRSTVNMLQQKMEDVL